MKNIKYLFSDWNKIKKELNGKFIYLFVDYDGTLAPITKNPGKAFMPWKTRRLLRCISKIQNCKVTVISGRALKDVEGKVGLKNNIVYVGNHGFEIKGPKIKFKSPVPLGYRRKLEEIKDKLTKSLSSVKGVLIEDKGFSLSVHYRQAEAKDVAKIKSEFHAALVLYEARDDVKVRTGKKILEIRPPVAWDKGKVVLWLLARHKFLFRNNKKEVLPIYIGDDMTDEDAFESLKGRGVTIFVGKPKKTNACFFVRNVKGVSDFIGMLLKEMRRDT